MPQKVFPGFTLDVALWTLRDGRKAYKVSFDVGGGFEGGTQKAFDGWRDQGFAGGFASERLPGCPHMTRRSPGEATRRAAVKALLSQGSPIESPEACASAAPDAGLREARRCKLSSNGQSPLEPCEVLLGCGSPSGSFPLAMSWLPITVVPETD